MPVKSKDINKFVTASYQPNKEAPTNIGGYELDKSLSTRKAKVYHDPITNKTIVANRGTTGTLSDWANNLEYIRGRYGSTDRMKQAEHVQDEAIKKYGKVDTNITHSQSAIIGRRLNEEGKTGQVIEVNPAIMFEKQKKNEHIIKSTYDPVSALTNINPFLKKENIHQIKAETINPLIEHSADILQRVNTEYGKGMRLGINNVTSSTYIDSVCKNIRGYHGCFIKDKLPKLERGFYVINLDGTSHWTCLCIDDDCYYFDSFGFLAPTEVEKKIGKYYWNDGDVQDIDSSACGYYCIAFIKHMSGKRHKLKAFNDFLKLFSKDTKKNDMILKMLVQ